MDRRGRIIGWWMICMPCDPLLELPRQAWASIRPDIVCPTRWNRELGNAQRRCLTGSPAFLQAGDLALLRLAAGTARTGVRDRGIGGLADRVTHSPQRRGKLRPGFGACSIRPLTGCAWSGVVRCKFLIGPLFAGMHRLVRCGAWARVRCQCGVCCKSGQSTAFAG